MDERRGSADHDDLHPLADVEDVILVIGAGRPHLAVVEPDRADRLQVRDALHDGALPADERRRARAQLGRLLAVRA